LADIAEVRQKILAAKQCVRALRQQIIVMNFIWSAALLVMFGLAGGLTGGWTGAVGLMAMWLAALVLGERIGRVMARRRYAAFLRSRWPVWRGRRDLAGFQYPVAAHPANAEAAWRRNSSTIIFCSIFIV
jgi:hypothetical protein